MELQVVGILSSLRIRPEFSGDDPWNEYFKRRVDLLETDWMFLDMLRHSVEFQSKYSDELRRFLSSVMPKMTSTASSIRRGLESVQDEADLSGSKPNLVELIDVSQRETDILKSVVRKALDKRAKVDYFPDSSDSSHADDPWKVIPVRWKDLILKLQAISDMNMERVNVLIHSLQQVILYAQFIADVKWYLYGDSYQSLRSIDRFAHGSYLIYMRCAAVRIAIHSCNCWFSMSTNSNCNTRPPGTGYNCCFNFNAKPTDLAVSEKFSRLVDSPYQIILFNPEFLESNLKFLKFIPEINGSTVIWNFTLDHFLRSILVWKGDYEFKGQMMHLLAIVITNKLDYSREDVQTFFAEIRAVLEKAASLSGQGNEADPSPSSLPELDRIICLLKAEYFLKYHLNNSNLNGEKFKFKISSEYLLKPHATTGCWKNSLALIKDVEYKVESLHQSYSANKCSISMLKNSLLQSLLEIVIFKAEFFLLEFLKSNASAMSREKVQAESLLEHLKVFYRILTNMLKEDFEKVEIIFTHAEAFARRITLFSYSFFPNTITEVMLKDISPMFPVSNFPTTYKVGFIDFLLRNLGELLKYSPKSIAPVKKHIEEIQLRLKSFLKKVSESNMENPGLKDLINHTTGLAYKLDYVIESIEVDAHWQHFFWFYYLLEDLRLVDQQASSVHVTTSNATVQNVNSMAISDATFQNFNSVTIFDATVQTVNNVTVSNVTIQSANNVREEKPAVNKMVVDLMDAEEYIIDRLTKGSSQLDVVPIVGMPGIGKTTLAMKMYNSQQVKEHFHCLAWCSVSQVYEKKRLLLEILNSTQRVSGEIHKMSTEELELTLHRCLLGNKYLIVMDDVWSAGAWDDLKESFPNDDNRSRILLTSRQKSVALEINQDSKPYDLPLFSMEESWKLLEMEVFKGESCPEQLLIVGKEIAQRCQGLPLAVVAIAGLLRTEKSQSWWTRVAESLNSQIINDAGTRCMEIFELSYKYLPEHLKACFLYLGVFLENNHIPVSKVMQFWLAEGFIKTESKSLEEVAEEYLMDLIDKSLVIISKIRSNGKVKECRLHDLLYEFCRSKAKEEKFFQLVTRFDEPYASFPGPDHDIEFDDDHRLDSVAFESYRLSITLKRSHFINSRPSGPSTRSLIFFASTDSEPRCPYEISFISDNFKTLRVLDLECINMGTSFPNEIGLLVQLRFLAVSGFVQSIPESIGNLWKLEILLVQGLRGGKVFLPYTIWRMTKLRHLHVTNHVAFSLHEEEAGCSFQLDNLVSFSFLALTYGEGTEKILVRFRNLRKLKCIFKESRDSSENCNKFPALNLLTHLESLNIVYPRGALNPREFILPSSLKQLTLSNCRLPWDHISTIGKLPSLEVLKLVSGAFEGQKWDMREEEFQELKFLKLEALDIAQWNATSDHLPKLQRLVLQNCKALQKVPDDFEYITSLEIIEVHWCGQSAEESAIKIREATNEEIKVVISHC